MTLILHRKLGAKPTSAPLFEKVPRSIFCFGGLTTDTATTLYLRWETAELSRFKISAPARPFSAVGMARGTKMFVPCASQNTLDLTVDDHELSLPVAQAEPEIFEGLNTLLTIAVDPQPQNIVDWLRYHQEHHGAEAALIVNRLRRGQDSDELRGKLSELFKKNDLKTVMILDCFAPIGANAPDQRSRYMAADAPGRQRLDVPKSDPWAAPFVELGLLRLLFDQFLAKARACLYCDITDLVKPTTPNIFDATKQGTGFTKFRGHRAYPFSTHGIEPRRHSHHTAVSFDGHEAPSIWCIDPAKLLPDAIIRQYRVSGMVSDPASETFGFWRCMGLAHPELKTSEMVAKSSLIQNQDLDHVLSLLPKIKGVATPPPPRDLPSMKNSKVLIVTTMKNEGPFILEWLAYHRAIGVTDFLVYTNDCTDGTDAMFDLLQAKGLLTHRENPYRNQSLRPQHAALFDASEQEITKSADWVIPMDVDEFINIHVGDGTLSALFDAVPDATLISMTWRLFGNGDVTAYDDRLILEQFTECAPVHCPKPHQAWGFKTAFRNLGHYRKFGVHRPKGLNPENLGVINWVNGSGQAMPPKMLRNGWRSSTRTIGYDLVTLNHYSLRSAESFLVKRDRGRVNHVERDQGLSYWFRMNHNKVEDRSIQRMIPAAKAELDRLLADPEIAAMHASCVAAHRAKIAELMGRPDYVELLDEITGERLRGLSRMLENFGNQVFLDGPSAVPLDFSPEKAGT